MINQSFNRRSADRMRLFYHGRARGRARHVVKRRGLLAVDADLAVLGAGLAGHAVVGAEVALFALGLVDVAVAAVVRELTAGRAARHVAVGGDVHLAAEVALFVGRVDHAVTAVRTVLAHRRAAAVTGVVVLHATAERV